MMTLQELLAEQKRCSNRLYDEHMIELYLAITKEVNRMAESSTLDISNFDLSPSTFVEEPAV